MQNHSMSSSSGPSKYKAKKGVQDGLSSVSIKEIRRLVNNVLRLPPAIYVSSEHSNGMKSLCSFAIHSRGVNSIPGQVWLPLVKGEVSYSFSFYMSSKCTTGKGTVWECSWCFAQRWGVYIQEGIQNIMQPIQNSLHSIVKQSCGLKDLDHLPKGITFYPNIKT